MGQQCGNTLAPVQHNGGVEQLSHDTRPNDSGQAENDQEYRWPEVAGFSRSAIAEDALSMLDALYNDPRSPIDELRRMPYVDYLETSYWQELRRSKVRAAGFRCERCRATNTRLDVHHLNYERRGYERREDLVVLCKTCHESEHGVNR